MWGEDSNGSALEQRIRQARHMSIDGTTALYDLTYGIEFSKPRQSAEAIARVLWREDVQAWWKLAGGKVEFTPSHKIEIRVPDEHNRRIAKTVGDFKADLENTELADYLSGYLASVSDSRVDWATVFLMGPLWAYLMEGSQNKQRRREELDRLFSQMSAYITVSPQ